MSEINVRLCALSDADAIQKLSMSGLGYDYPIEKLRGKLKALLESQANCVLVAEFDGEVVGYIHAVDYDLLYADHCKNIMGIAVSPEHRRQGIGKALLSAVEQWAKATRADRVRLCSGEERISAHEFYKSCGYSCSKTQLNFSKNL